jgi:deoxyhypusine synthase
MKHTLCRSEILKIPVFRKPMSSRKLLEELGQYLLIMEKSTVLFWAYKNGLTLFGIPFCKKKTSLTKFLIRVKALQRLDVSL